ncbi:MAG TPA: hypothetical protein VE089_02065 [Nitrososphaeraceae archaeon]|jgi:hypothetical protein|nr:hypothetical protein [Nitrososphaeraceae archaeon]
MHISIIIMTVTMKIRHILIWIFLALGCILIIAGIIFTAQSKSVIGPESSFMYNNPQWTVNGYTISILGLLILAGSILIRFVKKM